MRVATEQRVVQAEPGSTVDLVVDVVNTGDLIDGITAQLIGLPGATTTVEPKVLPLFPGAQGQITLTVEVPPTQPAGSHPITVEVVSHGAGALSQHVDVDLSVSARPGVRLGRTPHTVRSRRSGRFVVEVENTGNTALDVALDATREDNRTAARFSPHRMRVEPGATVPAILVLKGPRMITGAEIDRTAAINLTARRTNVISAMQETEQEPELQTTTTVVLRQRPILSRGLLTALVLAAIIGLWAAVFLLGLTQVLSGDPVTKTAPASFFPLDAAATTSAGTGDADGGTAGADGGAAGAAGGATETTGEPAGAMPKDGTLPAGVGGTISGTVTAVSNKLPVGRILVEAYRESKKGPTLVSAAATQSDGTYSLAGLFPTSYTLRFSADGFEDVWYPAAKKQAGATPVPVTAQGESAGNDAVVAGEPAKISGTVDQGSSLTTVPATVTARPLDILTAEGAPSPVVATTTTDAAGNYVLANLPAPATYEIAIAAEGYAVKTVLTTVSGGEERLQPSVIPSAASGQISGTVTDGTTALGGVTVSTTVNGEAISVVTPTIGAIGAFTIGDLPTPGTYVLTFTADDHGSTTEIVDLAAGESRNALKATLVEGTGSVAGHLLGPDGKGLGGASVTVGGTASTDATGAAVLAPTTTTLTDGDVGAFSISGLDAPGEYTLTFTKDGYGAQSVPVSLGTSGPSDDLEITLTTQLGTLLGSVVGPSGNPYAGATVTATDGLQIWTAASGAKGRGDLGAGGYQIEGLPPGSYAVTVTASGLQQQTALVKIIAGVETRQALRLRAVS